MRYDKIKFTVGIFVILFFILLFLSVFLLLKEKGMFEDRYTYNFKTYTAEHFSIGMPLKFSGFDIGTIDNISLNDDGSVDMTFSVGEGDKKWLSEGSVLMMMKPLIGTPYVELFSSIGTPLLQANSSITILSNDSINDLIVSLKPIVEKSINILTSIDKITTHLASEDSELKEILQNINKLTKKLADENSLLTSITGDDKSTKNIVASLNETGKIINDIKSITGNISKITASLDTNIISPASSSVKSLDLIMKDIKLKLDAIDSTVNSIGSYDTELIEIKNQISVGIVKSNQMMDKIDSILSNETDKEIVLP